MVNKLAVVNNYLFIFGTLKHDGSKAFFSSTLDGMPIHHRASHTHSQLGVAYPLTGMFLKPKRKPPGTQGEHVKPHADRNLSLG